jgi:HlyD family secretion protein
MHKINSTVVTLGLAGIVALAIGFYVNNVNWGPVGEEKTQAGTPDPASATTAAKPATATPPSGNTWAASATGRVEPKSGEIRVMADVPGRIEDITVDLNDKVKSGDLLVRLDSQDALTKLSAATAEAAVRVRERDEEQVRGLALDRRNAEDTVANAERTLFGARQAFDDAQQAKRDGKGSDDAVSTARKNLEDSKRKLATARADLATVNGKSGMPLPTRLEAALAVARSELSAA